MPMDRLEALLKLLEGSSVLVDRAAQEIVAIPYEPKRQNLKLSVQALSAISDLLLKLYKERPHLTPRHLQPDTNHDLKVKAYDANNPIPPEIQNKLEIATAIKLLESLEATRNAHLSIIAEEQLPTLRRLLNET